jgi:hypothetical protein
MRRPSHEPTVVMDGWWTFWAVYLQPRQIVGVLSW